MSTEQNSRGSSSLGRRAAALLAALGLVGSLAAIVAPTALAAGPDTVCTASGSSSCSGNVPNGGVSYAPTGEVITMGATTTGSGNAATGTWTDTALTFTYSGTVTTLNVALVGGVMTAAACGPLNSYPGVEFVQLVMGPTHSRSYLYPAFFGCPKAPKPSGGLPVSGTWNVAD